MSLVHNEQTKLLANAFDRASTACLTIGIATPLAGYLYNVANFRGSAALATLAVGFGGWLTTAVGLHLAGRFVLRRLRP